MLVLLFHIGADRYAIETRAIIEIVPLARLKAIPQAPGWVAGLLDYRGRSVPVVDLCRLSLGQVAAPAFSSRTLIVRYRREHDTDTHVLGLTVERVLRTERMESDQFVSSGVDSPDARYLGPVASTADGMVQVVEVNDLLTDEVHRLLFPMVGSTPQSTV
ncbi:MAG: chemotaxis protein CheW [Planctomycetota bacterium]